MPSALTTRRFTVDEYHRMAEVGVLAPGERVELIDGKMVTVAAIGSRHAACVDLFTPLLVEDVGREVRVRIRNPVRLGDSSELELDVALVRLRPDHYAEGHPRPSDVLLVIEVADTTVDLDRDVKAPLYAAASIPEYCLVDLPSDALKVHRDPTAGAYGHIRQLRRGDHVRPWALPELEVAVSEVLA